MNKFLWLMSVLTFAACSKSITKSTKIENPISNEVIVTAKEKFPDAWFGEWVGKLEIYNSKGLSQTVPMKCVMGKTDTVGVYKWYIVYGEDTVKGLRPYLLRTIDAAKGHYLCDEMNTIKMESYLLGNKLFCTFAVEGNLLSSTYEKDGDKMIFEIIFGKEKPVSETGGQTVGEEKISIVKTFPVVINQRAVLRRK